MKMRVSLLVHVGLLAQIRVALGKCYYPNGGEAGIDTPCDPDAENSMCCAGGVYGFVCLENKLCLGSTGKVVRGSCTDKDWLSPECASYCTNVDYKGQDLVTCSNVTKSDTSYCCDGEAGCCDSGVGRFDVLPSQPKVWAKWSSASDKYVVVLASSTASSSTASTSTSSTSTSSTGTASISTTASSTADSEETPRSTTATDSAGAAPTQQTISGDSQNSQPSTGSTELTTGAKVGIGVGAAVGAILVAAVAILAWKLHKIKQNLPSPAASYGPPQELESPNNFTPTSQWQSQWGASMAGAYHNPSEVRYKTELPVDPEFHELAPSGGQYSDGNSYETPILPPNQQPPQQQQHGYR